MSDNTDRSVDDLGHDSRLSSQQLAGLIIDALVDAQVVQESAFERAVKIASEEIEARKTMGDY